MWASGRANSAATSALGTRACNSLALENCRSNPPARVSTPDNYLLISLPPALLSILLARAVGRRDLATSARQLDLLA